MLRSRAGWANSHASWRIFPEGASYAVRAGRTRREGRVKKLFAGLSRVVLTLSLGSTFSAATWAAGPLRQVETIALPNVAGRIDHFSADVRGRRLFVSALANHTVEVVDLAAGKSLRSLPGVAKPQGECYVGRLDRLFTADGTAGNVKVYGGSDLRL